MNGSLHLCNPFRRRGSPQPRLPQAEGLDGREVVHEPDPEALSGTRAGARTRSRADLSLIGADFAVLPIRYAPVASGAAPGQRPERHQTRDRERHGWWPAGLPRDAALDTAILLRSGPRWPSTVTPLVLREHQRLQPAMPIPCRLHRPARRY